MLFASNELCVRSQDLNRIKQFRFMSVWWACGRNDSQFFGLHFPLVVGFQQLFPGDLYTQSTLPKAALHQIPICNANINFLFEIFYNKNLSFLHHYTVRQLWDCYVCSEMYCLLVLKQQQWFGGGGGRGTENWTPFNFSKSTGVLQWFFHTVRIFCLLAN